MGQIYKTESGYLLVRVLNGALVLELSQARWWFYDSVAGDLFPTGQFALPVVIPGKLGQWTISQEGDDLSIQVVDPNDNDRVICVFHDKLLRIEDAR